MKITNYFINSNMADNTIKTVNRSPALQEVIAQHNLWVKSKGEEGKRLDLSGLELPYANFAGTDLACSDFTKAVLVGADFSHANVHDAYFKGTILKRSDFTRADISGADLSDIVGMNVKGLDTQLERGLVQLTSASEVGRAKIARENRKWLEEFVSKGRERQGKIPPDDLLDKSR